MKPERCVECGGELRAIHSAASFEIGRRKAVVEVHRFQCADCGEEMFTPEQADAAQIAAADEFRRQDGLLTPREILAIRDSYRLTQAQFEKVLGVGPKTVVRWERGTVFQNPATDQLLRVIREVPQAFAFLAKKNGVVCEAEPMSVPVSAVAKVQFSMPTAPARKVLPFKAFSRVPKQQRPIRFMKDEFPLPEIPMKELR